MERTEKRLVMIGNGMAGMKAIEEILKLAPSTYDITIFGADRHPNYNRVLLSRVLAGEMAAKDITLNNEDWYRERGITLHLGKEVSEIWRGQRRVVASGGVYADYDRLVIATGSSAVILNIPGQELENVLTFRDISDCERIKEASRRFKRAAVIGGGLLGLEAAGGLVDLGMDVTVIHDQMHLMNMQLDKTAGEMLKASLEKRGIKFRLSTITTEILGDGSVGGLRFSDGSAIGCDVVIQAVGIRPNKTLAERANLYCNRGVVVNDYMQTLTDPSIYAVGECTEHRGKTYGLIAPLFEQARILAYHITGHGFKSYRGSVVSSKLKVSGVDVFSAGELKGASPEDEIYYTDRGGGVYKKLVLRDGKVSGAILFGDTNDCTRFFQMMQDEVDVRGERPALLFGNPMSGDTGHSGPASISMMAPSTVVCGCNGVTKKEIVDSIAEGGLTTRHDVTKKTKAGGSCGGCIPLIEELLVSVLGSSFMQRTKGEPICDCAELTHEEVKKEIRTSRLTTVRRAMEVMGWKGEGCGTCRPAINYYVQMTWPGEAKDDPFSRHVNERLHANIQKEGTFSVIPRIYGGAATPDELMRLAGTAKKYNVRAVKITGGQRIALLGIRKEDLRSVWGELGMKSGYAYAKALRTVKTCVGNDWCRFGTQDSMGLGITLEKILEGVLTPAKVKLSVSGCPRNCAESSIKDLGIVGIEGGWEVYIAGCAGVKARVSDLLCAVSGREEVIEIAMAYLEFYREDARYGERTSAWVKRVGLERIKKSVVDDAGERRRLKERMDECLRKRKEDPWEGPDSEEVFSAPIEITPYGGP
ncbi:MAG: NAD(P)/FAD-dependent oxidoreductase [Deltaproteobacteria bacterium]|nr:NAD(P)/FAD-dependent oxidoreductase [Deltaproteobacteria bacterium]